MANRESIGLVVMTLAFVLVVGGVGGFLILSYADTSGLSRRSVESLISRGQTAANREDFDGAFTFLAAAIDAAPASAEPYLARADVFYKIDEHLSAHDDYSAAIERDPTSQRAFMGRARTRERMNNREGAIADYGHLIELDPAHAGALRSRARIQKDLGAYAEAVADFERAIAIDPGLPRIDADVAWAYWGAGDYASALTAYDRTTGRSRTTLHDRFGRGVTLYHLGRLSEAREELVRAKNTGRSGYSYAAYYLWLTMVRLGEQQEADRMLAEMNAAGNGTWSAQIGRFLLGKITEEEFLDQATAGTWQPANEQLCEAYFYTGSLRLIEGDDDIAAEHFTKCIETGVNNFYEFYSAMQELRKLELPAAGQIRE